MKSDELVRKINNGEIKVGTEIIIYLDGEEAERAIYKGKNIGLEYKNNKVPVNNFVLLNNDIEFEIVEEHKGWFKHNDGDYYYCIDHDGIIRRKEWEGNALNYYHYNNHNCFRHREEAYECEGYRNALKEAEKPFEIKRDNYFIRLNSDGDNLFLDRHFLCQYQGITYLGQDEEVAQAFIDKWKKQILKYEFDIWE